MAFYIVALADLPALTDTTDIKSAIIDAAQKSGLAGGTLAVIPASQVQAVSFTVVTPPPQVTITDTRPVEDAR